MKKYSTDEEKLKDEFKMKVGSKLWLPESWWKCEEVFQ